MSEKSSLNLNEQVIGWTSWERLRLFLTCMMHVLSDSTLGLQKHVETDTKQMFVKVRGQKRKQTLELGYTSKQTNEIII